MMDEHGVKGHGRAEEPAAMRMAAAALALAAAIWILVGCESPESEPPVTSAERPLYERLAEARLVDLTHPLGDETIVWPTSEPFHFETVFQGWTDEGFYYEARTFSGPEHGGTHLDAPIHFYEDRWTTDQIPLERMMGPAAVVDVREPVAQDPNYQVTVADLEAWEAEHGVLPARGFLFLYTGRDALWPDAEAYMGTAEHGEAAIAELEFPGLDPEAARWLVAERDVVAVGLDTPSLDHGPSTLFESHQILFEANVYGLENVANLGELPPTGATVVALPMPLEDGSGGPVRIVAVLE
jgi:kynurenine formamidase